jgi:hypothetical protein
VLLDYIKGRTGPEGASLPRKAIKLLSQWLEHSSLLRRFASPDTQEQLWISIPPGSFSKSNGVQSTPRLPGRNAEFVRLHNLRADDDSLLIIHQSRVRTTYLKALSLRGWAGRTTIDPNHSATVEGDHYLTASTPAQMDAIESIIADGQGDIARRALPPAVLNGNNVAELISSFQSAITKHSMDDSTIRKLLGGEQDVFVAACSDQLAGVWGPAGKPCPARPWVCLLCPLAIFVPHHAENLLRLKAFFSRQFRELPTEHFMAIFGPYASRLENEILPLFDKALIERAAASIHANDSALPLRPEETG